MRDPPPAPRPTPAPPHLDHEALARTHAETLATPWRRYSLAAGCLVCGLNVFYGRARTLEKFRVLELIARVPYQAWEQVAHVATTHIHEQADLARRIYDRVLANARFRAEDCSRYGRPRPIAVSVAKNPAKPPLR
jgi:hypothetical protein